MLDANGKWHPFPYTPSTILPIIFLALFVTTTLIHIFQMAKARTWYLLPLAIGGIFEIIGFIGRLLSHENDYAVLVPYIIQAIFILIAPALFAASIYIILGRIILLVHGERYSVIRQKHLTAAFVAGDVLSFHLQANGSSSTAILIGKALVIAGLFTQLLFFGLFIVVAGDFHRRLIKDSPVNRQVSFRSWKRRFWPYWTPAPHRVMVNINELPWKRHIYVLYIASLLVFIRSFFRVVEYIQGEDGYFLSNEVFLYSLDSALMVLVMVLFNLVHPGHITLLYRERLESGNYSLASVELQNSVNDRALSPSSEPGTYRT
ncbi:RTA1-domain-containing protein [Pleomassaria siparia CBS 279.74]|uniref:RTA1-domain-containing protein n=1 Tax=Pleomassaria siparia CBS 279.74 TaxID=1314801 RepID=A0A6G1KIB8_9PLEO|nr:RTA1-domain-containing protein [Pleomassaria siparia CBS 279.74]